VVLLGRYYERDLPTLEDAFPAQAWQCGAVLAIGRDLCLDLVSRPDAFARLWPKLRAGYLLDALERLDGRPTPGVEIGAFVEELAHAETTRRPSAGLGDDLRLRGRPVIGSGLVLESETIQLSAFRSEDGGRRAFGRIARPSRRR
jgi:ARG and Rhodanese-Phosphatase-superfamily-associated Protein domain